MEKTSNFVINGGMMRLPVGYRFCPTDEELVEHYLKRKAFDLPLPASVIPDFDVFLTDPSAFPGDFKEKRFFFSKQRSLLRRNTGCGIWKSTGKEKLIVNQGINKVVGLRKSLVFYESKVSERTATTRWVMHEYRLPRSGSVSATTTPNSTQLEMEDWAVYSLFQKRRRPKKKEGRKVAQGSVMGLLRVEENGGEFSQPCSSCSSGVTQVSSNGTESTDQEESSSDLGLGLGLGLGFSSSYYEAHVRGV
ncbi:NAC domain-containing protein 83-like isoform X2 [Cucurbita moschata]|uniref:NAC domain-containing protein 83-like isoform X1 n=2 Tax=Cucurbita TaxID=3660 RepID=A0A6J1EK55_CUCMO